jgi:hypothetical protein
MALSMPPVTMDDAAKAGDQVKEGKKGAADEMTGAAKGTVEVLK